MAKENKNMKNRIGIFERIKNFFSELISKIRDIFKFKAEAAAVMSGQMDPDLVGKSAQEIKEQTELEKDSPKEFRNIERQDVSQNGCIVLPIMPDSDEKTWGLEEYSKACTLRGASLPDVLGTYNGTFIDTIKRDIMKDRKNPENNTVRKYLVDGCLITTETNASACKLTMTTAKDSQSVVFDNQYETTAKIVQMFTKLMEPEIPFYRTNKGTSYFLRNATLNELYIGSNHLTKDINGKFSVVKGLTEIKGPSILTGPEIKAIMPAYEQMTSAAKESMVNALYESCFYPEREGKRNPRHKELPVQTTFVTRDCAYFISYTAEQPNINIMSLDKTTGYLTTTIPLDVNQLQYTQEGKNVFLETLHEAEMTFDSDVNLYYFESEPESSNHEDIDSRDVGDEDCL